VSNKLLNKIPKALSLKGKKIPDNFNFSKLETSSLKILLRESKDKTKNPIRKCVKDPTRYITKENIQTEDISKDI
jgi:hypothetical protein